MTKTGQSTEVDWQIQRNFEQEAQKVSSNITQLSEGSEIFCIIYTRAQREHGGDTYPNR
jgi:hypothetical protein